MPVDFDTPNVIEGGPNTEKELSICTPLKPKHTMGLMLHNDNGDSANNCMVYSRKRRFQKKNPTGQPSTVKMTPTRLRHSQTQHPQGTLREGHAVSTQQDSTTEIALINEDIEEASETLKSQDVFDIWNRATKLGATGGDDPHPIIEKLREMEDKDMNEAVRLGNSSGYP